MNASVVPGPTCRPDVLQPPLEPEEAPLPDEPPLPPWPPPEELEDEELEEEEKPPHGSPVVRAG
jgi:hypothetical protein